MHSAFWQIFRFGWFVSCPGRCVCVFRSDPTSHFTILEPQNPWIDEFYVVQERCTTDSILKLQKWRRSRRGGNAKSLRKGGRPALSQFQSLHIGHSTFLCHIKLANRRLLGLSNGEKDGRAAQFIGMQFSIKGLLLGAHNLRRKLSCLSFSTDPITISELQNPSCDVSQQNEIGWFPDLEALKLC